jgi:hypothetical protein
MRRCLFFTVHLLDARGGRRCSDTLVAGNDEDGRRHGGWIDEK